MSKQLSNEDLETALEMLAVGINDAGTEKEMLFMSKLCFALANQLGDLQALEQSIELVKKDL